MTTQKKIIAELTRAGLECTVVHATDKDGAPGYGIMVTHDYTGLYPTDFARDASNKVQQIARRYGLRAEPRGHYIATLIYCGRVGE